MILCDTGPLLALVDKDDRDHQRCRNFLENARLPLISRWPCLTESMYLVGRVGGWSYQKEMWRLVTEQILSLHEISRQDESRMQLLMEQYRDLPMDFADASLVAAADSRNIKQVFTLDSHVRIYRTADGGSFEIFPQ